MNEKLLSILYEQVLFFSDNGQEEISSPNIMVQEVHKYSGRPRNEVIALVKKLMEIGFIEQSTKSKYGYVVKEHMTESYIKTQLIEKV